MVSERAARSCRRGLFYKKISTYVQTITTVRAVLLDRACRSGCWTARGVNANDDFSITNVINTPGGPLKGLELNYQQPLDFLPEALRGFGVLANYTYVDSEHRLLRRRRPPGPRRSARRC